MTENTNPTKENPDFDNILVSADPNLAFLPWRSKVIEEIGEPLIGSITIKGNEKDVIVQLASELSSQESILSIFYLPYIPKTLFFEVTNKDEFTNVSPVKKIDWVDKKTFMRQFCNSSNYRLVKPKDRIYARVTHPPYKDDFCEVIQLSENLKEAIIRVIPRLNIPELELSDESAAPFNIKLLRRKKITYEDKEVKMSFDGKQVSAGYSFKDMNFIGNSQILKVPTTSLQFYCSYTKDEMENFKIPIRTHQAREETLAIIKAQQQQQQKKKPAANTKSKSQTKTQNQKAEGEEEDEEESSDESSDSSSSSSSSSSDSSSSSSSESSSSSSSSSSDSSSDSSDDDKNDSKDDKKRNSKKAPPKRAPAKGKVQDKKGQQKKKQESSSSSSDSEDDYKGKIKKRPQIKPGSAAEQRLLQYKLDQLSHFNISGASSEMTLKCSINDTELAIPILMRTSGFSGASKPKMYSLVELPTGEVAVVVGLDKTNAQCLIFLNRVVDVPLSTELPILPDDNTVHDRHGRRVFPGDVILVKTGPREGFQGTVTHTRNNRVFGNFVKDGEEQSIFACGREIELIEDDMGPINI